MKILLASPIDPAAHERLQSHHDVRRLNGADLRTAGADREVVVLRSGLLLSGDVLARGRVAPARGPRRVGRGQHRP